MTRLSSLLLSSDRRRPIERPIEEQWRKIVSFMAGLAAPLIILAIIDPARLLDTPYFVDACMIGICMASIGVCAVSLFFPGEIQHVWIDGEKQVVSLIRKGICSCAVIDIPFAKIKDARWQSQNGSSDTLARSILELSNGKILRLPIKTTQSEISALKAAL